MRRSLAAASLALALSLPSVEARAQEPADAAPERTFRAELYVVRGARAPAALEVQHLRERPGDLGVWVKGSPEKVQTVTVTPGQPAEVVKVRDLTFRISGLYRGAQKDRMFLKVSFDQGGQAAVKEFLASLDETVAVTYPMKGGDSFFVLLVSS